LSCYTPRVVCCHTGVRATPSSILCPCTHSLTCLLTFSNSLQHTATHCNTLQHNTHHFLHPSLLLTLSIHLHCNTLQHTATHCTPLSPSIVSPHPLHPSPLQHTVTHLQHTTNHFFLSFSIYHFSSLSPSISVTLEGKFDGEFFG